MAEKFFSPPHTYIISWPLTTGNILPRPFWVRLNRLRTGVGLFRLTIQKWGRDEHGPEPDRSRILTFFGRIEAELGFSARQDRSRIVMSRVCQLKYAMTYVWTPLSFKSKRRIKLLIYNPIHSKEWFSSPHNSTSLCG